MAPAVALWGGILPALCQQGLWVKWMHGPQEPQGLQVPRGRARRVLQALSLKVLQVPSGPLSPGRAELAQTPRVR